MCVVYASSIRLLLAIDDVLNLYQINLRRENMGAQYSSLNSLKSNEYLSRFVSEETISVNDPFWNQFLSFRLQSPFTT